MSNLTRMKSQDAGEVYCADAVDERIEGLEGIIRWAIALGEKGFELTPEWKHEAAAILEAK